LLLSSEHAHLLEVSSTARSQRALNFEFLKSLEIEGFLNNLKAANGSFFILTINLKS